MNLNWKFWLQRVRALFTVSLVVGALFLTGCDQKAFLQSFIPKDDDSYARKFVDALQTGDEETALQMLDPSLRDEKASEAMRKLHQLLAHGEPISVETIGWNIESYTSTAGTTRHTNLTYQIHLADSWVVGNVLLKQVGETRSVVSAHFQPVKASLEVLNRFTLLGKSPMHYATLAACVVIPLFILAVFILCLCTPVRRKWLWIIFILFGVGRWNFDWTTGQAGVQPLSILLPGAAFWRASSYAPVILSCAFPLGAVVFLVRRRRPLIPDIPRSS